MYYVFIKYDFISHKNIFGELCAVSLIKPALKIFERSMILNKEDPFTYCGINIEKVLNCVKILLTSINEYNDREDNYIPIPLSYVIICQEEELQLFKNFRFSTEPLSIILSDFVSQRISTQSPGFHNKIVKSNTRICKMSYLSNISYATISSDIIPGILTDSLNFNGIEYVKSGKIVAIFDASEDFKQSMKMYHRVFYNDNIIYIIADKVFNEKFIHYGYKYIIHEIQELVILDNGVLMGKTINDINLLIPEIDDCDGIFTDSAVNIDLRLSLCENMRISEIHEKVDVLYYKLISRNGYNIIPNEDNDSLIISKLSRIETILNEINTQADSNRRSEIENSSEDYLAMSE